MEEHGGEEIVQDFTDLGVTLDVLLVGLYQLILYSYWLFGRMIILF